MDMFKARTNIEGTEVRISNKIKRYFDLSRNVAYNSPYGKIKHGALLVKGGSVLNASFNKKSYTSFGSRFRNANDGPATVHAEIGCILGIPRDVTMGSDLYVCRINTAGEFKNSQPCPMCHEALKHVGVKRVYYTTDNLSVKMYKL